MAVALVTAPVVAACSGSKEPGPPVAQLQSADVRQPSALEGDVLRRYEALPARPAGEIAAEGPAGSLTARAAALAHGTTDGMTVRSTPTTEAEAFGRLCAGEIDIVDSRRPIGDAEWDACDANGLGVVQVQVAAEAVVLAAGPETEWAGECVTATEAGRILTDPATTTWAQAGFDDVPLEIGGSAATGRAVAGIRDDYRVFASPAETADWAAGAAADRLLAEQVDELAAHRELIGGRLLAARRAVVGAADRQQAVRFRDRLQTQFDAARRHYLAALEARGVIEGTRGNLALLTYAEHLAVPQLEPFAVQDDVAGGDCVAPVPATIAGGEYPLARPLLLTTTTRSLDRPEVVQFLELYLTESARLAAQAGVAAAPQEQVAEQLSWLTGEAPVLSRPGREATDGPTPHEPVREQPAM